jgi:hypothetical protein
LPNVTEYSVAPQAGENGLGVGARLAARKRDGHDHRPRRVLAVELSRDVVDPFRQVRRRLRIAGEIVDGLEHYIGIARERRQLVVPQPHGDERDLGAPGQLLHELEQADADRLIDGEPLFDHQRDVRRRLGRFGADDLPFLAALLHLEVRGGQIGDRRALSVGNRHVDGAGRRGGAHHCRHCGEAHRHRDAHKR